MRKTICLLISAITLAVIIPTELQAQSLRLMTYNIRYDNPDDGDDAWSLRKEGLSGLIRKTDPDIIGLQEVLKGQLSDLEKSLKGYAHFGVGRDDGAEEGEYAALFIRTKRLKVVDQGYFWLSQDPTMPAKGWDAACIRICTWLLAKDITKKKDLLILNTHLDHEGKIARKQSVLQLLDFIRNKRTEFAENLQEGSEASLEVVLMGDFNFTPADPNYALLAASGDAGQEGLSDAYVAAPVPPAGPAGSFNGFDPDKEPTDRIDYIWCSGMLIRSCRHIDGKLPSGRWPSDHLPVVVEAEHGE
jgi:endonuclease/exonuclease/phosphatase family metal-dependent hydrolase